MEHLDLVIGRATPRVLKFLNVGPSDDLQPETVKRNPSDLLERFANPQAVERTLQQLGAEQWAAERPVAA